MEPNLGLNERKHGSKSRTQHEEVFNIQHIAFELAETDAPEGHEGLRQLARFIARRMQQEGLANTENAVQTMPAKELIAGRLI